MRIWQVLVTLVALIVLTTQTAVAAPFKAEGNPQIVALHLTGDHGIVGEDALHVGKDVVMETGVGAKKDPLTHDAKITQQWFEGIAYEGEGGSPIFEGDHSVWMLSKDGKCPGGEGWYLLENVNTSPDRYWGDYLTYGADYCVKTNDYKASEQHTP